MYIEGINPTDTFVAAIESPIPFAVGQRGKDNQSREFVFCSIVTALTAGDAVMLPITFNSGVVTPLTTAAALYNRQVGITMATFAALAAGTGFWACVQGAVGLRASAAATINLRLYTTATAGALLHTASTSPMVRGATFTTTATGAGVFAGLINYPTIGTVDDTDNQT